MAYSESRSGDVVFVKVAASAEPSVAPLDAELTSHPEVAHAGHCQ